MEAKKYKIVSRLSSEADYRSIAEKTCELTWLRFLLNYKQVSTGSAKLLDDNQVSLHIAANPVYHKCTKHIELDNHVVREKNTRCSDHNQICLISFAAGRTFTKALEGNVFKNLQTKLNILDIHVPTWNVKIMLILISVTK